MTDTNDAREALTLLIADLLDHPQSLRAPSRQSLKRAKDVLAAIDDAGWAPPISNPVAVTEAMVEAACGAFFDGDGYQWDESTGAERVRASMRAALTAALREG
jgi:hypothetical protein